ncbi:hypothetical protein K8I28_05275 [bacterium]|nr:hypothetical protein [bacterium]
MDKKIIDSGSLWNRSNELFQYEVSSLFSDGGDYIARRLVLSKEENSINIEIHYTGSYCAMHDFVADNKENNAAINEVIRPYKEILKYFAFNLDELHTSRTLIAHIPNLCKEITGKLEYNGSYHEYVAPINLRIGYNRFVRSKILETMYDNSHLHARYSRNDLINLAKTDNNDTTLAIDYLHTLGYVQYEESRNVGYFVKLTAEGINHRENQYLIYGNSAFLIIWCNKELDEVIKEVYKEVIEKENGFKLIIQEREEPNISIHNDIYDYIKNTLFSICDLSGKRPNCYYEAGYAHGLGKKVIFTIREEDIKKNDRVDFDFDLIPYKHSIYDPYDLGSFKKELSERVMEILSKINEKVI